MGGYLLLIDSVNKIIGVSSEGKKKSIATRKSTGCAGCATP